MGNKDQYTASRFIEAIPGSGGIITTIAQRVGCQWQTAKKYITEYATVRQAYEAECETTDDIAESVLVNNIKLALRQQKEGNTADSSDARWWLERRRRDKYSTKQEVAQTTTVRGDPAKPVKVEQVFNPDSVDWSKLDDAEIAVLNKLFNSLAPNDE